MRDKSIKYNYIDKCSIHPDKVVLTTEVVKYGITPLNSGVGINNNNNNNSKTTNSSKLTKSFHNFNLSINSQRNLRNKIKYLFIYAKKRRIKTYKGKILDNFKVCFLTLTLPAKQIHPTSDIVRECLIPFLDILRKRLKMMNYVYRLEFQSNGNVHFHIVTDTYVDYYFARRYWNHSVNRLGYKNIYKDKMNSMSYTEYSKCYGKDYQGRPIDNGVLFDRYNKGCKSNWNHPNTVDVKNSKSSDNIDYYISKYFSKKDNGKKCNDLDNESNSFALRLCYWSRSLSRLSPESLPIEYYTRRVIEWLKDDDSTVYKVYDYCKIIYFNIKKVSPSLREWLYRYFFSVRDEVGYISA